MNVTLSLLVWVALMQLVAVFLAIATLSAVRLRNGIKVQAVIHTDSAADRAALAEAIRAMIRPASSGCTARALTAAV